jgi:RNA polymerase sigma-70 factor (ECF subfamily)
MSPDNSFVDLMARLRAGDEDAAQQVFRRFSHQLVTLAHTRLEGPMLQKLDAEDVVQSVFGSFFARQAEGQFDDLGSWDSLWGLLITITLRKCGHHIGKFRAASRNVRREVSFQAPTERANAGWDVMGQEPTPSQGAMLREVIQRLVQHLEKHERPIFQLSFQGLTGAEIAARLGCSERSVQQVMKRVREQLELMRGDRSGPSGNTSGGAVGNTEGGAGSP